MNIQPISISHVRTVQLQQNRNNLAFRRIDSSATYGAVVNQATSAVEKIKDDLKKQAHGYIKNKQYAKAIQTKEKIRDICFEQGQHDDGVQMQRGINELYRYL